MPTEYDSTEIFYGTSYGPVQYSPQAHNLIVRISNQFMTQPVDVEADATVEPLSVPLSRSIRDFPSVRLRGDRQAASRMFYGQHSVSGPILDLAVL